jgi:hypothetical protein
MTIREAATVVVLAGVLLLISLALIPWSILWLLVAVPAAWAMFQGLRALWRALSRQISLSTDASSALPSARKKR